MQGFVSQMLHQFKANVISLPDCFPIPTFLSIWHFSEIDVRVARWYLLIVGWIYNPASPFFFYLISLSWLIDIIKIKGSTLRSGRVICCQCFFNSERKASESFLFGERKKKRRRRWRGKRREGWQEDEKGREERVMRLLGFNQYGIWPEDDWKTNLIWEAIRLSFISLAVSPVDLCGSFCHLFPFNTHHSKCRVLVHRTL